MVTPNQALHALDFGQPDSESEPDLDRRFVRTEDFARFLDPRNMLILGPKGSGKSALFEMFAKHLPGTRKLADDRLDRVLIATGTGFGDSTELTTTDIQSFSNLGAFQYDAVWKLYIALKLTMHLGSQRYTSDGPLKELLRATKRAPDYRIGPMMSSVWQLVVGGAPEEIEIKILGSSARIRSGRGTLDVIDLLEDIHKILTKHNQRIWMLFDKIDEIHPGDPDRRDRALEGLFPACMSIHRMYPNIVPRIFIRSDLYGPQLNFTNKSHLEGKQFVIDWDAKALQLLLLKRALVSADVREFVESRCPSLQGKVLEALSKSERDAAFHIVFADQPYKGQSEAKLLSWLMDRATDASGSAFPREFISYANIARSHQIKKYDGPSDTSLISGRAFVDAYYDVSRIRCQTYLTEFHDLQVHIRRFRGRHDAPFSRTELIEMFDDLDPEGDDAIERLHEVGVIAPRHKQDVAVAESFDIPRLYRSGLGLSIKARP